MYFNKNSQCEKFSKWTNIYCCASQDSKVASKLPASYVHVLYNLQLLSVGEAYQDDGFHFCNLVILYGKGDFANIIKSP